MKRAGVLAYVDSSVIVARIFGEPHPGAIDLSTTTGIVTSEIARVECLRAIDGRRSELTAEDIAELTKRLAATLVDTTVTRLSAAVLKRAGEAFPTRIRTLDALHVATALLLSGQTNVVFHTHDRAQGATAQACGLVVRGV